MCGNGKMELRDKWWFSIFSIYLSGQLDSWNTAAHTKSDPFHHFSIKLILLEKYSHMYSLEYLLGEFLSHIKLVIKIQLSKYIPYQFDIKHCFKTVTFHALHPH